MQQEKYIAALDIGTTTLRCHIINSKAELVGSAQTEVKLIYPQPGYVEINPDDLWHDVVNIIKAALRNANLQATDLTCLGIATQRGSFITWQKDTERAFHNFITWKDLRSNKMVDEWNKSWSMMALKRGAWFMHLVTRKKRFLAGSSLTLSSAQANMRLLWVIENIPEVREQAKKGNVRFATLETWLVYKLTFGGSFVTDISNASATGLYDPFVLDWSSWAHSVLGIPKGMFPEVVGNDYDFGCVHPSVFGVPVPIKCVIADQQSSMMGSCSFTNNILKVTLGTGAFLDVQTDSPHGSVGGIYPLVGRKINGKIYYIVEGSCNDTGSLIQWALKMGLASDASETASLATSVPDNDGVYFIPAFSGLGPPICDDKAASGFLGIKPTTRKAHMLRAVLESIVFRIVLQYELMQSELTSDIKYIYVDGGVSKNDFICQLLADMTNLPVQRPNTSEICALGCAFVAGLNSGVWKTEQDFINMRKVDKTFQPTDDEHLKKTYKAQLKRWNQVAERFKTWYP